MNNYSSIILPIGSYNLDSYFGYDDFIFPDDTTVTLPTLPLEGYNLRINNTGTSTIVKILPQTGQTLNGVINQPFLLNPQTVVRPFSHILGWYLLSNQGNTGATGATGRTGATGQTGIQGITGATGPAVFPPFANPQIITIRPNQRVELNVITGIAFNPGFGPTLLGASGFTAVSGMSATRGGALTNPGITVTSVTIVDPPANGLTFGASGVTGNFSYRPLPRFTGTDYFSFNVTDASGVQSKNSALAMINVVCRQPGGSGPRFLFSSTATPGQVFQYNNGATQLLFTAALGNLTINNMATNRDDGLIYYSQNTAGTTNIYAYDYIGNTQFLLTAAATPLFPSVPNWSGGGAVYNKGVLYMGGATVTTGFYKIFLSPYIPGSGQQTINSVSFILYSDGLGRDLGCISYDETSSNLLVVAIQTGIVNSRISLVNPTTGNVLSIVTLAAATYSQMITGPDNVVWLGAGPANAVAAVNPDTGTLTFPSTTYFTHTALSDMAEWICQPVPL